MGARMRPQEIPVQCNLISLLGCSHRFAEFKTSSSWTDSKPLENMHQSTVELCLLVVERGSPGVLPLFNLLIDQSHRKGAKFKSKPPAHLLSFSATKGVRTKDGLLPRTMRFDRPPPGAQPLQPQRPLSKAGPPLRLRNSRENDALSCLLIACPANKSEWTPRRCAALPISRRDNAGKIF